MVKKSFLFLIIFILTISFVNAGEIIIFEDQCDSGIPADNGWTAGVSYSGGNCYVDSWNDYNTNIDIEVTNDINWTLEIRQYINNQQASTNQAGFGFGVDFNKNVTIVNKGNDDPTKWFSSATSSGNFGTFSAGFKTWELRYNTTDNKVYVFIDDVYNYIIDSSSDDTSKWNTISLLDDSSPYDNYWDYVKLYFESSAPTNFYITSKDSLNDSSINIFNATMNEELYQTINGTITTPYLTNSTDLYNITVRSENYYVNTTLNYNVSNNLEVKLKPFKYFNITAKEFGGASFNIFNATINDINYYTSNGTINTNILDNSTDLYNIIVNKIYYNPSNYSNYNISLSGNIVAELTHNNVNISIYRWDDKSLLSTQQVDIYLDGTNETIEGNTSTGYYQTLILNGWYDLVISSDGFADNNYGFNSDGGTININAYLWNESDCSNIGFIVEDLNGLLIEGATLSFYKKINSSWVLSGSRMTDMVGSGQMCLDELKYKLIIEKDGYNTWEGEFYPTTSPYTIRLGETTTISFETEGDLSYYYNPTNIYLTPETTNFTFLVSSATNTINTFGLISTYDNYTYSDSVTGSYSGGQITMPINLSNNQRYFNVTYYVDDWNFTIYYQSYNESSEDYSLSILIEDFKEEEDNFTIIIMVYLFLIITSLLLITAGAKMVAVVTYAIIFFSLTIGYGLVTLAMGGATILLLVLLLATLSKRGGYL